MYDANRLLEVTEKETTNEQRELPQNYAQRELTIDN